jgi:hypothetical protein
VAKLGISPPNVPIPNRSIVMMKKHISIKKLKRTKLEIRRNYTSERKTCTPKNTLVHLT